MVSDLEPEVRGLLAVENDDVSFDAAWVLEAARRAGIPMVLDWHHAQVHPADRPLGELVRAALATWPGHRRPKLHLSSPASEQAPRDHAGDVRVADFEALAGALRPCGRDCDVLLEAKAKDRAVKKLAGALRGRPGYRVHQAGVIDLVDET